MIAILAINLWAFVLMGVDKYLSTKDRSRIAEHHLLWPVIFAGILGVLIGMKVFNHKVSKSSFKFKLVLYFIAFVLIWALVIWFLNMNHG